jgi:hypothetical protein
LQAGGDAREKHQHVPRGDVLKSLRLKLESDEDCAAAHEHSAG